MDTTSTPQFPFSQSPTEPWTPRRGGRKAEGMCVCEHYVSELQLLLVRQFFSSFDNYLEAVSLLLPLSSQKQPCRACGTALHPSSGRVCRVRSGRGVARVAMCTAQPAIQTRDRISLQSFSYLPCCMAATMLLTLSQPN